ncbi:MAG: TIGR00153 family protein [Phycisphaerae bacterium]|nr:TIGR00153 family protein [Phycisphaerae bacterium]
MSDMRGLFKISPFEPLREHLAKAMECVAMVKPMFEALREGDHEKIEALANEVFKAEHQADIIKNEIRQTIPRTFFLPVFRGDLLGYLKLQDDLADSAEDIAVLLTIKRLRWPLPLDEAIFSYINKVLCVCSKTKALSDHLPVLVEQNFDTREVDRAIEKIKAIEKAEWEADRLGHTLAKALFAEEDNIKTTDILLWSKVFGELGQLANHAENIGDRLRRMLASH